MTLALMTSVLFSEKSEPFQLHILVCSATLCSWRHPEAALGEVLQHLEVATLPKRNRPLKDKHDYLEGLYMILICMCASVWPPLDKVHPEGKTDAVFRQTFPWIISPLQSLFYFLTEVTLCKQIARVTSKHFSGHYKCTINTIHRCCNGTAKILWRY